MQSLPLPPKVKLANLPTPLRPLDRLTQQLGGPRIWIKQDELTELALSGNKVRKLEFVIADALQQGCDTLITCGGVQSNHCRATAIAAARMGLRAHLVLRGPMEGVQDGNLLLDNLAGAEISVYDGHYFVANLEAIFEHWKTKYLEQGNQPYVIPMGASNGVGVWGYLSATEEILQQASAFGFTPDALVCATGSGGTQAGLTLGCHLLNPTIEVHGIAVCDSAAYFNAKTKTDVSEWAQRYSNLFDQLPSPEDLTAELSVSSIDRYIGPGYAQGYPELFETISSLASLEGVFLDPVYTGKAFYGLIQEIKQGRFANAENIVFVHTGGIFGLYPYRNIFENRAIKY
ncbi:D-cysteine desulfhydrase [Alteromonadaceae bacterium 2753L.S.0a.02]|nr:D-cysteine desulfhydrase [Alteromonadaceae bacterium 2753L.S.0a.02]